VTAQDSSGFPLPDGFAIGHWTDLQGATGCTVVLTPDGTRGAGEVLGGGPGTREMTLLEPLGAAQRVDAVLLTGGSAYGLAAADGVMRWLEERGIGHPTPAGPVPLVPAAVVYDLATGDAAARPDPASGYTACEAAAPGVPERGTVGAGTGAAVGKLYGRERAVKGGLGYAAARIGSGDTVAAVVVANSVGDVLDEKGGILAGPRDPGGGFASTAAALRELSEPPDIWETRGRNTTLACIMTSASLDKTSCAVVARMGSAGISRAVEPAFTPVDGDCVICLASGSSQTPPFAPMLLGTAAAGVVAAALRDAIRAASGLAGLPAIVDLDG
jgi:L-aminopeptidase/D-esterase-like protein